MSDKYHDTRLSVAVVIRNFTTTGGAEKFAVEIAQRLSARGHRVHIFAWEIDSNAAQGMQKHLIPKQMAFSSALSHYRFTKVCSKRIHRNAFDVVHCHEKGVACDVSTVHTFSYLHGFERFSWLKKINTLYLSPRGFLYYWLEKKQLRSSAVVAVSEIIRRDIQCYFPETDPIHTITPGVDLSLFKPNQSADGRTANRPDRPDGNLRDLNVLFVGSEFRRKGLDQLIPALPERARLVVVGKGEHLSHYHQLVGKAGLQANVVFKGLVDNVRDYYAEADVLVLPSLREAFGMAVLEAMACGLPVVVSSTTGVADLIDDGHNGFVFKSARELTSILRRLCDRELKQRIGVHARQTAMRHTWDKAADEYESIYWNTYQKKQGKKN